MGLFSRKKDKAKVQEPAKVDVEVEIDDTKAPPPDYVEGLPSPATIHTHLKLLEAFYTLQTSVENQQGLFGTNSKEQRWSVFCQSAARRFETWWHTLGKDSFQDSIPASMIPPLDVLMVWHAYLLNPKCYVEDAVVFGMAKFKTIDFPWAVISQSVWSQDGVDYFYDPGPKAKAVFEEGLGLQWDSRDEPGIANVSCVNCRGENYIAWVNNGSGFGEPGFDAKCEHCGQVLTHELMKMDKLHSACERAISGSMALGFVDYQGQKYELPYAAVQKEPERFKQRFSSIQAAVDTFNGVANSPANIVHLPSSPKDRNLLQESLKSYWETSANFSLDLAAAVIRQSVFAEQVRNQRYLDLEEKELEPLVVKYGRFFHLVKEYPHMLVVPTVDVDLVWHTHLLSPRSYIPFSQTKTGILFDHDDKVDENVLATHFALTCKVYELVYKEVYSECICWFCEASRQSYTIRNGVPYQKPNHKKATEMFYSRLETDTAFAERVARCSHISAHHAVQSPYDTGDVTKKLYQNFIDAWKRNQRHNRPVPVTNSSVGDNPNVNTLNMADTAPYSMRWRFDDELYPVPPALAPLDLCGAAFARRELNGDFSTHTRPTLTPGMGSGMIAGFSAM